MARSLRVRLTLLHSALFALLYGVPTGGEGSILTTNENRHRQGVPHGRAADTEGDQSTSPHRSRDREEAVDAAERFAASDGRTFRGVAEAAECSAASDGAGHG